MDELEGRLAQIRIVDRRSDFWGHINVDHIIQTDRDLRLVNLPLTIPVQTRYLLLPIAEKGSPVHCRLRVGDEVVYYFHCHLATDDATTLFWATINVDKWRGKELVWEAGPPAFAELLARRIRPSDVRLDPPELYRERFRPQFHFSPRVGWMNDPNGLVYYDGEYHLFFQHNPYGIQWGNMTWGHAVSRDLIHWEELEPVLHPDRLGTIFSGSAVVDDKNTSGLGDRTTTPLCAFYTAAGRFSFQSQPFTQCLTYSLDRGRTWTKYPGNPILGSITDDNRDPKVFWYAPAARWIMVLYVRRDAYSIFSSTNLREWTFESEAPFPTAYECPELFELEVEGSPGEKRWVLWAASGNYLIGQFDGKTFTPETEVLRSEWGPNAYAGQTWNNTPDGRRVLICWMRSDGSTFRGMPFNQQMSIPRELTLRKTESGPRLFARPVRELASLRQMAIQDRDAQLSPFGAARRYPLPELVDLELTLELSDNAQVTVELYGIPITLSAEARTLECLGHVIAEIPAFREVDLRVLVDRTSLELFAWDGRYVMSFCRPIPPSTAP